MSIKEAINLLKIYHKWRLGDDETPMQIPSDITKALETILNYKPLLEEEHVLEEDIPPTSECYHDIQFTAELQPAKIKNSFTFAINNKNIIVIDEVGFKYNDTLIKDEGEMYNILKKYFESQL